MGSGNTKVAVAEPERPSGPPSHGVSGNSVISATNAAQTIKKKNEERFEEVSEHGNRPGSVMSGPHDRGSRNSGDASARPGSVVDGRSSRNRPGSVDMEPNLAGSAAAAPGPGPTSRPTAAATSSRPPAPSAAAQTARALAATDAAAADVTYELMNARKAQAASFLNSNDDDSDSDASLDNTARRPPAIVTTANGGLARRPATTTSASTGGSNTNSTRRPPPSRAAALAMGKVPISSSEDEDDSEGGSGSGSRRPPSHAKGYEGLRPTTLRASASPSSSNSFGNQSSMRGSIDFDAQKNSTPSSSRSQSTPSSARSRGGDPTPPSSHSNTPVAGNNNINSARGPGYSGIAGPSSTSSGTPGGGGDSAGGGKGRRAPPSGRAPPNLVGLAAAPPPDSHLAPGTGQGGPRAETAATPGASGATSFENSANRKRANLGISGSFDTNNNNSSSGMRDPGVRRPRPPSVLGPPREPTLGGGKGQQTPLSATNGSSSVKGGKGSSNYSSSDIGKGSSSSTEATSRGSTNDSGGKGVGSSTPGKGGDGSGKGSGKGTAMPRRPPTTNRGGGPSSSGIHRPHGGGFQPKYQPNTAAPPPGLKPRASFRKFDSSTIARNNGKGKGKGSAPPSANSGRRLPLSSPVNQSSRASTATSRHDSGPGNSSSNDNTTTPTLAAGGKVGTPSSGGRSGGGGGRLRAAEQGSAAMVAEMADSVVYEDGNGEGDDGAWGSDSEDVSEIRANCFFQQVDCVQCEQPNIPSKLSLLFVFISTFVGGRRGCVCLGRWRVVELAG